MLKNYLKIAWRNLTRNKTYAAINIGGLAIGLAVFIIIMLFVRHELSYNGFFSENDKIYRVLLADSIPNFDVSVQLPEPIAGELKRLYPEVEKSVRVNGPNGDVLIKGENKIYIDGWATVGKDFFGIFDFPFIAGNPAAAVSEPNTVVITEGLAKKLFGRTDAMGETIIYDTEKTYTVTGIIENLPSNTHFNIKAFAYREPFEIKKWNYRIGSAYIKLHKASQIGDLRKKSADYPQKHARFKTGNASSYRLIFQPIADIHLYPKSREAESSRLFYIKILIIVAALILLVACINYMNLATARSAERSREIGIRKTAGAYRRQIISQIMVESAITCLAAFLLSLALVELFRPFALHYLGISLSSLFTLSWWWVGFLALLVAIVGLLSGGYAALYLSSFQPAKVLKGKGAPGGKGATRLRKVLVAAQFGISIAIVISTLLISKQMEFVRTERLNVQGDQVMVIRNNSETFAQHFKAFKNELLQNSSIQAVSAGTIPNQRTSTSTRTDSTGNTTYTFYYYVRYNYLDVMGLNLVAGRTFNQTRSQDSITTAIINETAARIMGIDEVKGQMLYNRKLIGIVEDFHARTMFDPLQPILISLSDLDYVSTILVRLKAGQITAGIDDVRAAWEDFVPAYPLNFNFLDEILDRDYRAELRMARIFNVFSIFSIIIACLGLFGLAAFAAERRTKEIGIRKVLGATVTSIVGLLSKDFLKLVLIGFVVAAPVAWYFMNRWLADFAYRIDIGIGIFLLAGGLALLIALATVSWQSIRAALANPVDSLRSE